MNEFAKLHDGDAVFKRVMFGAFTGGLMFAFYMLTY